MRKLSFLIVLITIFSCSKNPVSNPTVPDPSDPNPPDSPQTNYFLIRGMDLSFIPEIEEYGIEFKAGGVKKNILDISKEKGINTIRLRLWNAPANSHSSLAEVADFAKDVKARGLKFWLDFHYSDTWADPGKQTKPSAWNALSIEKLKDSIYTYTKNIITYLSQNSVAPDFVQIGNEINSGILWNEGKVNNINDANWQNFADLLKKGIQATRDVNSTIKIILHIAGYDYAQQFFDKLQTFQTDYDIIGISYYPIWHGKDLNALQQTVTSISGRFQKPILIAETSYPFTLSWNDNTNNIVGLNDQLVTGYPATNDGQAQFISRLISISAGIKKDNCGVCYWGPEWVAFKGPSATDGSAGENLALFDFQNNSLPALDSLGSK